MDVDLDAAALTRNPGLLHDEAASLSMFADFDNESRRVVMVRTSGPIARC